MLQLLSHIGDLFAIPLFALLTFYFYQIQDKNEIEWVLYVFGIAGFILDILFTGIFLGSLCKKRD